MRFSIDRFALTAGTACAVLFLAAAPSAGAQPAPMDPEMASGFVAKPEVRGTAFMVTAANPLAVEAGYDILKAGGNAVDAAIATQMVLNLVEPQSSGIGGGAFLLYYDAATGTLTAYDGRETAPAAATPDLFLDADGKYIGWTNALTGGRSTGVPGVVRMLGEAHAAHGKSAWADLFTAAIALSEDGFEVSDRLSRMLASSARMLRSVPDTATYFYTEDGAALAVGSLLKNPAFAATLRRIATDGADAFYEGPVAEAIVARIDRAIADSPHPDYAGMTLEDIATYRAKTREPVCGSYRVYQVCGMGPPSSGGVAVLQILGMLEPFDMGALGPESAEAVHLIAEASRRAYADRALYLADADFVPVPVGALTEPGYLLKRSAGIDPAKVIAAEAEPGRPDGIEAFPYAPTPSRRGRSTTHLSVVDADGNAASLTSSIETGFGSRLMAAGFLLNNQLTDFSAVPAIDGVPVANAPAAGKRPLSSMSPTIVFDADGSLRLVIGSPGGPAIIGFVAKTIVAHLDWGLGIQAAIDYPHILNQNGSTVIEDMAPVNGMAGALEAMGHTVRMRPMASGLHGIAVTPEGIFGSADGRREGIALGD